VLPSVPTSADVEMALLWGASVVMASVAVALARAEVRMVRAPVGLTLADERASSNVSKPVLIVYARGITYWHSTKYQTR
jgi:hypothetical protein